MSEKTPEFTNETTPDADDFAGYYEQYPETIGAGSAEDDGATTRGDAASTTGADFSTKRGDADQLISGRSRKAADSAAIGHSGSVGPAVFSSSGIEHSGSRDEDGDAEATAHVRPVPVIGESESTQKNSRPISAIFFPPGEQPRSSGVARQRSPDGTSLQLPYVPSQRAEHEHPTSESSRAAASSPKPPELGISVVRTVPPMVPTPTVSTNVFSGTFSRMAQASTVSASSRPGSHDPQIAPGVSEPQASANIRRPPRTLSTGSER